MPEEPGDAGSRPAPPFSCAPILVEQIGHVTGIKVVCPEEVKTPPDTRTQTRSVLDQTPISLLSTVSWETLCFDGDDKQTHETEL